VAARNRDGESQRRPGEIDRVTRLSVWPPLPPVVYLRRPARQLPFPLHDQRCRLFALGRHALWRGVTALGMEAGDEVLVPAYHHGSEVEALTKAGLVCRFYAASEDLRPEESELETLVTPQTRALLLIHYLGFPQDTSRWRGWCDDRGLILIEDAAQAWLARDDDGHAVGSRGDLAIFCLYKTYGISEGAAIVSRRPPAPPSGPPAVGAVSTARRHVSWMLSRAPTTRHTSSRQIEPASLAEFDLGDPETQPSRATQFLLRRVVAKDAAAARRRNYEALLHGLRDHVAPPFESVPDGASPFVFPLDTGRKQALLEKLRAEGIQAFDFWSVGHPAYDGALFPALEERRRRTIGLPVHQELLAQDIDRLATVVGRAMEREIE
jgi:perosamine synthetase